MLKILFLLIFISTGVVHAQDTSNNPDVKKLEEQLANDKELKKKVEEVLQTTDPQIQPPKVAPVPSSSSGTTTPAKSDGAPKEPEVVIPSRVVDINEKKAREAEEAALSNALFTFVLLKTSMGNIRLKLYKKDAPRTVENFVGLANGTKAYRDLNTGKKFKDTPFYRNLIFHKVHPELGIQTGCPWGNGKGWPGYTMKNEPNDLLFDRPYLVGMAKTLDNPNSVGSQFFITTAKSDYLTKDYTVFGEVVQGEDVVKRISLVKRDAMMKPLQPVKLEEVIIE